ARGGVLLSWPPGRRRPRARAAYAVLPSGHGRRRRRRSGRPRSDAGHGRRDWTGDGPAPALRCAARRRPHRPRRASRATPDGLAPPRFSRALLLRARARPAACLAASLALRPTARLRRLLALPAARLLARGRFPSGTLSAGHAHVGARAHRVAAEAAAAAVHHAF